MEDHLRFVESNTYLCNYESFILQQTIGIPTDTNAAPEIANLTFYYNEATYIDKLNLHLARAHAHTRRYIDDLLLWNTTTTPSS